MNYIRYLKIGLHKFINITLICAALYLIISSIIYYNNWPIYTSTEVIPQQEAQFPAVTFCNQANGYKENVLKVSKKIAILLPLNHQNTLKPKKFLVITLLLYQENCSNNKVQDENINPILHGGN